MDWENKTIGFAMCGSFCTFKKAMGVLEKLTQTGANVIPIMSEMSYNTDTRFGKAEDFRTNITPATTLYAVLKTQSRLDRKTYSTYLSYCHARATLLQKLQTELPTHLLPWQ